jgi:hypothetical protein
MQWCDTAACPCCVPVDPAVNTPSCPETGEHWALVVYASCPVCSVSWLVKHEDLVLKLISIALNLISTPSSCFGQSEARTDICTMSIGTSSKSMWIM